MATIKRIVPHREPEVVRREAERFRHGDDEKVATTSITSLTVEGVEVLSRYDKAHELEVMQEVVLTLPLSLARTIKRMWCDSKACSCYDVVLRLNDPILASEIAKHVHTAFADLAGGHNGIWIRADDGDGFGTELSVVNPWWVDDVIGSLEPKE